MIRFFILPALLVLTSFSSFSQNEAMPTRLDVVRSSYRGCCAPVVMAPARCTPVSVLQSTPSIYTEQVVQRIPRNNEVLDITDPEISNLAASPNPTKGQLSISVSPSLIGYSITIIDMTGRFVGNPIPITGTTQNLSLEGESGVYLLMVRTEKEVIKERILLDTQ